MTLRSKTLPAGTAKVDIRAIWFDRGVRALLGVAFAYLAGSYFISGFAHLQKTGGRHGFMVQALDGFSLLAIGLYSFLIASLYVLRLRPVNKFAGWVPAATAIVGGFLLFGLLFLKQRTDLSVAAKVTADSLVMLGNIFTVYGLSHLGRSFSILPEGRKLVTSGPYRFVRHPLYVGEAIATFGTMIYFLSPAAVALVAAQMLLQLGRIHYEEKVLRKTFPQYAAYSRRTARLIPGIY